MQKEAKKKLKYNSLGIEIQWMWNPKCTVIPVTIGATGIVTKSLRKNLETIPGKHSIDSLQQTAILVNITHNMESTAVWNLKPERCGSMLVQENCREESLWHETLVIVIIIINSIFTYNNNRLVSLTFLRLTLTLCRSYLNLYCLGRKTAFFSVGI
jgi:uncharacterized integral membrane protein